MASPINNNNVPSTPAVQSTPSAAQSVTAAGIDGVTPPTTTTTTLANSIQMQQQNRQTLQQSNTLADAARRRELNNLDKKI